MIDDTEAEPELLRIKTISVKGLFGLYDHTIPLNLDDRVTIIHGPNGVGKTKILHWIASLLRADLNAFLGIPFERFAVTLTNGSTLSVEPIEPRDAEALILRYVGQDGTSNVYRFSKEAARHTRAPTIRSSIDEKGTRMTLALDQFRKEPVPQVILEAIDKVNIHLVEAQRLFYQRDDDDIFDTDDLIDEEEGFSDSRASLVPTVVHYSQHLRYRIREALAEYASTSQALDQSFPQRLIQHRAPAFELDALKQRMTALEATREQLGKIGLLDKEDRGHPFDVGALDQLEPERRLVLSVYVEDSEAKLQRFEDLARRIQIFLDNINEKLINKRVSVVPKAGLVAVDDNGSLLALTDLSSGEQHEIVLLYDLLFNVRPNTLVLIDEPELSLHITWQKRFLDDLLEIAKTVGIDALVATHSPFIVGEREDLMVPLEATPTRR